MGNKLKHLIFLAGVSLVTTLILWLPFILNLREFWGMELPQQGMATVVANFDGPYYIVAAKTLYNPAQIELNFSFPLSAIYYSAHYPLFPLLIRAFATILPFLSYPYAMIVVTSLTSILTTWMLYILLKETGVENSLWLASLFTFFPARWLIIKSIGSPEPLFLFVIIASVYFFIRKQYWLAALFGIFAQWTKAPGILLFIAFVIAIIASRWSELARTDASLWIKKLPWKAYPVIIIPISLVALFMWYSRQYGNFFAYFNSGDNIHLLFPPFQVFNPNQPWVGAFWLEEIIWIYLLSILGFVYLVKQRQIEMAAFVGVFLLSVFFVSHRDVARYILPIVPFLFVAFSKTLSSNAFRLITIVLVIPIYLFSLAFITNNVTPIADWGPLL